MDKSDQYCEDVLTGKITVKEFQNTSTSLAYYSREPEWRVHIILIPKQHIGSLLVLEDIDGKIVADLLKDVASAAKKVNEVNGKCRVLTNVGEYQHTKHLHWHIYCE